MLEWRTIEEFPIYEVSNTGVVRNKRTKKEKKPNISEKGYELIKIYVKTGTAYKRRIHRLVAQAFIPNPENKPEVNHKDGNKRNNAVNNLEWVTQKENYEHAVDMGLHTSVKYVKLQERG